MLHSINILTGRQRWGPAPSLGAFLIAYQDFLGAHLDLVRMWETASPGAWYGFWHRHVAVLLHVARPDLDADYLAHALLAADTHAALRERTDVHRVSSGIQALAALMLQEPPCAVRASCSVNIIRELRRSGLRRVTITMKKLVNDPADVVSEALRGMAAATPSCGSTIEQDYLSGWRSDVGEGRADLRGWLW